MECDAARQLVNLGQSEIAELDGLEREALEDHLDQCPDCAALWQWENHLADRMHAVSVPRDLRARIVSSLRIKRPVWRRWAFRAASAAAVLMLLFLFFWLWWLRPLPTADPPPYVLLPAHSKSEVEAAFKSEFGVATVAPSQFNYRNLLSYGMNQLDGQYVPHLVFFHRGDGQPAVAQVYVLSPKLYDVPKMIERGSASGSGPQSVRLLQGDRGFLFMVIFTGGRLEPFLKSPDT